VPPAAPEAVETPPGFQVEVVVRDLNDPTCVELDSDGNLYIAESGAVSDDGAWDARILRVAPWGEMEVVAERLSGPITGLLWHQERLYVSHRGRISWVEPGEGVHDVVTGLPSDGDHQNNQLVAGPDGRIYFGQGTVTNSGVVGLDNLSWVLQRPDLCDIPPKKMALNDQLFRIGALTDSGGPSSGSLSTSPFQPLGKTGQVVSGSIKANGTILRVDPNGANLKVYAWGLRNPYGLAWGPDGKLYASENGYDDRGSRPIANSPDFIWLVQEGAWYGFPDYVGGVPVTDPRFKSEKGDPPSFLMKEHPQVEKPLLELPSRSGVGQMEFSRSQRFGFEGQLFLAQARGPGSVEGGSRKETGHQVVRIDLDKGTVAPFFRAKEAALGPPGFEHFATAGPRAPIGLRFSPRGDTLYIADQGSIRTADGEADPLVKPVKGTGVVWRIRRKGESYLKPPADLSATP